MHKSDQNWFAVGLDVLVVITGIFLGMQVTEWPSHTASDDTVIEEGMVLTLEPGLVWAPGKAMVHEENLVVRAGGPERLTVAGELGLPCVTFAVGLDVADGKATVFSTVASVGAASAAVCNDVSVSRSGWWSIVSSS